MRCYAAWYSVVWIKALFFWTATMVPTFAEESARPIVIAHRGASGYLVEHTEGAKVLAHAQGSDYIEQDVVLSKDRQFVVTHDITMEETTNVEDVFPDRARSDGKWYFADFDWQELQALSMHERTRRDSRTNVFPNRFPGGCGQRILRLEDEVRLLRGLDRTTSRHTGFYIELKSPSFHEHEFGEPMGKMLVEQLAKWGIQGPSDRCFIQCFEWDELERLGTGFQCQLPLVYLLGRPIDREALEKASKLCYGIGPSLDLLADRGTDGQIRSSGLVESAHALGLRVHPYTIRREMPPKWSSSIEETHRMLLETLRVDGFFTDFPDVGRQAVDQIHP